MPMDLKNYPPNWKEISDTIRFNRANGECECCGECDTHKGHCPARHNQPHPETESTVILTVAHMDHDPQNNHFSNLRAMCQKCHLNYDSDYHRKNSAKTRRQKEVAAGQLSLL